MCSQNNCEIETVTKKSPIDQNISNTKKALSFDALFNTPATGNTEGQYLSSEFGFSNPGTQIVRRCFWLSAKLMALYLAKWFNRLFRHK